MTDRDNNSRPMSDGNRPDSDPLLELTKLFGLKEQPKVEQASSQPLDIGHDDPLIDDFDLSFLETEIDNSLDAALQSEAAPDLLLDAPSTQNTAMNTAPDSYTSTNDEDFDLPFNELYDLPNTPPSSRAYVPPIDPVEPIIFNESLPEIESTGLQYPEQTHLEAQSSNFQTASFEEELSELLDTSLDDVIPSAPQEDLPSYEETAAPTDTINGFLPENDLTAPIFNVTEDLSETQNMPFQDETAIVDPFYDPEENNTVLGSSLLEPLNNGVDDSLPIEGDPFGFDQVFNEDINAQSEMAETYQTSAYTPSIESESLPLQEAGFLEEMQAPAPSTDETAYLPEEESPMASDIPYETPEGYLEKQNPVDTALDAFAQAYEPLSDADQPPVVDSQDFDGNHVEATEPFEIPNVPYEETRNVTGDDIFHEEFDDIFSIGQTTSPAQPHPEEEAFFQDAQMHNAPAGAAADVAFYAQDDANGQNISVEQSPAYGYENAALGIRDDLADPNADYGWNSAAATALAGNASKGGLLRSKTALFAIGGAVILIGAGLASYSLMNGSSHDAPTIIKADSNPIKVEATNNGSAQSPEADQPVYNRLSGETAANNQQDTLVDNQEAPEDLAALNERPNESAENTMEPSSIEDAIASAANQTVPTRVVPTVIVNPDGSMSRVTPTETETTTPTEQVTPSTAPTQTTNNAIQTPAANHDVVNDPTDMDTSNTTGTTTEPAWAAPQNVETAIAASSTPTQTPEVPAATSTTSAPSVATPAAPINTVSTGGYYVQISSQPTRQLAETSLNQAKTRYNGILASVPLNIAIANIPDRGTYYRVRAQMGTKQAADDLCNRIKQAQGSCFVGR